MTPIQARRAAISARDARIIEAVGILSGTGWHQGVSFARLSRLLSDIPPLALALALQDLAAAGDLRRVNDGYSLGSRRR